MILKSNIKHREIEILIISSPTFQHIKTAQNVIREKVCPNHVQTLTVFASTAFFLAARKLSLFGSIQVLAISFLSYFQDYNPAE